MELCERKDKGKVDRRECWLHKVVIKMLCGVQAIHGSKVQKVETKCMRTVLLGLGV